MHLYVWFLNYVSLIKYFAVVNPFNILFSLKVFIPMNYICHTTSNRINTNDISLRTSPNTELMYLLNISINFHPLIFFMCAYFYYIMFGLCLVLYDDIWKIIEIKWT